MTISSTNAEASAGPNIKRQSMSLAGTNTGLWGGGVWGWEGVCEKVNSKNGQYALSHTRNIRRETNGWTHLHADRQSWVELESVTASSQQRPSHSFPVNASISQQSWGSPSDRLCVCYISLDRNDLLPARELRRYEGQEGEHKKTGQRGEKIDFLNKCKSAENSVEMAV